MSEFKGRANQYKNSGKDLDVCSTNSFDSSEILAHMTSFPFSFARIEFYQRPPLPLEIFVFIHPCEIIYQLRKPTFM